MIRPFSLRDVALVRRLSEQGTILHAESAHTRNSKPLREALLSLVGSGETTTYVWRADETDASGFVQLQIDDHNSCAQLLYLTLQGPATRSGNGQSDVNLHETAWLELLESAVKVAGRRGIHTVAAEVDESGPTLPLLRQAGFAVYTRQDVWRLDEPVLGHPNLLRPFAEVDDWAVEWLYANTVPPLIQLVEPSAPQRGEIWTLHEGGELTAFVSVHDGPAATWLQLFIHPNATPQTDELLAASVQVCPPQPGHPVYCCVRRYQSWLQAPLERTGFVLSSSQAVMVKHIAVPARKRASALDRLLAGQEAQPNTLLQRYESTPTEEEVGPSY